jgi:DNA-binding MarR family transcriptional regulator
VARPRTQTAVTRASDQRAKAASELAHLIPALRKVMGKAIPASQALPVLESQVSILRLLIDEGPMSPATVADSLRLARPTISNLVTDLVYDGLVERRPSQFDGRSVLLAPTDHGRAVLESFREGRVRMLASALEAVPAEDLDRLVDALPALVTLLEEFEHIADEVSGYNDEADGDPIVTGTS